MIDIALILLRDELINYLSSRDTATVVVDNIGLLETPGGVALAENIVITLVNVEEESTLKNQSALRRPFAGSAIYENPPVNLNLYVLFSCNYTGDHYNLALRRLSYVIRFLQSKNAFSVSSSVSGGSVNADDPDI
ncbi:MAG: Pvc16 family protein, partial [Ginsengibacter sp.]